MLSMFLMVAQQVVILFLLMGVGLVCNKTRLMDETVVKGMTDFVLYFVVPCVTIASFQRPMEPELVRGLLITVGLAVLSMVIPILLGRFLVHDSDESRQIVYRFAVIFSNCGFMSLPIEEALLGADGIFYGAMFVAVFNVMVWTYGLKMMSAGTERITARKLLLNPGLIGTAIGLLLFVAGITLPDVLEVPVESLAALNTPVPMVIIGWYLGNVKGANLIQDKKQYWVLFLRLIAMPCIMLLIMLPMHLDPTILLVCTIASCAPVATVTNMFAAKFDRDAILAARLVSMTTLFSLVTIPLLVTAAKVLSV